MTVHIDVHQLDQFVLWGSAVTFLAILAVRLSSRTKLPSLLLYLLMGVLIGESGLGIGFEDAELAHTLGFAALILILAEGGLTTTWDDVKPSMKLGLSLATHILWPSPLAFFSLLGDVAAFVYILDVKPALSAVTRRR